MQPLFPEQVYNIFDALHEAVLMVDAEGIVSYINPSYSRMMRLKPEDIIGKQLAVVRKGSKLSEVVASGVPQLGVHRSIGGSEFISNIVPLFEDGKIVGGISLATETGEIVRLFHELEQSRLNIEKLKRQLREQAGSKFSFDNIITQDPDTLEVRDICGKIANRDISVLILGESGTGKEVIAQAIHSASKRSAYPFIAVNCATLNAQLMESELFGYASASFSGARVGGKKGIFEEANKGTVFLDEIGDLADGIQAKLLRVLQEGTIRPVGESFEKPVDVRIVAATNKNLFDLVTAKRFRIDLYYRIASLTLALKPLRERQGDVALLIDYFLEKESLHDNVQYTMDNAARELLLAYDWPGNIRELYNCIRSSVALCDGHTVRVKDIPLSVLGFGESQVIGTIRKLNEVTREAEHLEIDRAIAKYGNSMEGKRKAAKSLGISIASLYNKIKKTGRSPSRI